MEIRYSEQTAEKKKKKKLHGAGVFSILTYFLHPGGRGHPEAASSDSLSAASRSEEPSAQAPTCGAGVSGSHKPLDSVQKIMEKNGLIPFLTCISQHRLQDYKTTLV